MQAAIPRGVRQHFPLATGARLALATAVLALSACQYMPHAYEPSSPPIPEARTLPIPGAILTFVSEGSGPPVLFVHGNIADLRVWSGQRGPGLKGYEVVSYSRRYHYPNAWAGNGKDYTEANHAEDLVHLIHGLHLGRVHLVGEGSGAQLAVEVALSHPELVSTLVLVEPAMAAAAAGRPGFDELTAKRGELAEQMAVAVKKEDDEKAAKLLFDWANASPGAYDALPPPLRGEILDNARVLAFFLAAPPPPMPCTELSRLAVPTLVVTGEHAAPFFLAVADAITGCVKGAVRETIPAAGHLAQRDNADAFNAALVGFLAGR
jgi:non-heme chloroperoxidase